MRNPPPRRRCAQTRMLFCRSRALRARGGAFRLRAGAHSGGQRHTASVEDSRRRAAGPAEEPDVLRRPRVRVPRSRDQDRDREALPRRPSQRRRRGRVRAAAAREVPRRLSRPALERELHRGKRTGRRPPRLHAVTLPSCPGHKRHVRDAVSLALPRRSPGRASSPRGNLRRHHHQSAAGEGWGDAPRCAASLRGGRGTCCGAFPAGSAGRDLG